MLWPTLRAVRDLGDAGTIEEIDGKVVELQNFSEEQQSVVHNDGPRTKIEYRLAWAKTHLKEFGSSTTSHAAWGNDRAGPFG